MKKELLLIVLCGWSVILNAQVKEMLGAWTTVDDKTSEKKSIVTIYAPDTIHNCYYGVVTQLLIAPPVSVCEKCEGDDHNRPVQGLDIIRQMQVDGDKLVGRVLDPESGKLYYATLTLKNGQLILRGSLDKHGIFGRNQTWVRQ